MPPTYEQNKPHIYKYIANNKEKVRGINRKNKAKYDAWKKIQKIYNSILIDDFI
jgi:hypothetical protein